jgi:hypothetical protein
MRVSVTSVDDGREAQMRNRRLTTYSESYPVNLVGRVPAPSRPQASTLAGYFGRYQY